MKSELGLIDDGYTIIATIERVPGIHPRLTLTYRPALAEERQHLMRSLSARDHSTVVAEILQRHLQAWDLKTMGGAPADCSDLGVLRRLQPTLQGKILDLVLGYSAAQELADEKNS